MTNAVTSEEAESYADIREITPLDFHRYSDRGLVLQPPQNNYELARSLIGWSLAQIISDSGLAVLGERGVVMLAEDILDEYPLTEDVYVFIDGYSTFLSNIEDMFTDVDERRVAELANGLLTEIQGERNDSSRELLDARLGD